MCKTHALSYTCKHHGTTRLSTCRGTFTVQPRPGKPPKPACGGAPIVVVKSAAACGDCQRRKAEEDLDARVAKAEATAGDLQDLQAEQYKLGKQFPSCRRYQSLARPGSGHGKGTERGSLLKREVVAEEVVVRWEAHRTVIGGPWIPEEWGTDFKSLSDELAERGEEETPSLDLPMTGCMGESMEEYCSAFGRDEGAGCDDSEERSEWQDDATWANTWSCETEESQTWTPEEATYWSSEPWEQNDTIPTDPLFESSPTAEVTPATQQDEDEHEKAAVRSTAEICQPLPPVPPSSTAASTRTPPARPERPLAPRRATLDGGGKMEIELRARFSCLRLPSFVCVGGD